jgi:hypothetical protein
MSGAACEVLATCVLNGDPMFGNDCSACRAAVVCIQAFLEGEIMSDTRTELEAMGACCDAFDALPPEAHKRLLQYLADRYLVAASIEKKIRSAVAVPSDPPPLPGGRP